MTAAFAIFVGFLLSNMPSPVYPLWQESMGFTASTTTVLFAIYQGGVLVGLMLLGRLGDRWGSRAMMVAALLAAGVAALAFAFAPTQAWLLAARAVSGLSVGVLASCGAAAVTEQQERRGRTNGPVVASVVTSMGLAFGPLLGGIGVDVNPQPEQSAFLVECVLAAGVAVLILFRVGWRPGGSDSTATTADVSARHAGGAEVRGQAGTWTAALVIATAGIICAVYMSIGSGFVRDALGVGSGTVAGLLVFSVFACAFASQLALRRASPSVQGSTSMVASILAAILLAAGLVVESVAVLFVSAALSGASQGLAQVAGLTIARRVTPLTGLRRAFAWLNFASYLFGGGFVLIAGVMLTALAPLVVVSVIGGLVCLMAFAGLAMLAMDRTAAAGAAAASGGDSAASIGLPADRG